MMLHGSGTETCILVQVQRYLSHKSQTIHSLAINLFVQFEDLCAGLKFCYWYPVNWRLFLDEFHQTIWQVRMNVYTQQAALASRSGLVSCASAACLLSVELTSLSFLLTARTELRRSSISWLHATPPPLTAEEQGANTTPAIYVTSSVASTDGV
jgi:hypothetical protein